MELYIEGSAIDVEVTVSTNNLCDWFRSQHSLTQNNFLKEFLEVLTQEQVTEAITNAGYNIREKSLEDCADYQLIDALQARGFVIGKALG